MRKIHRNYRRHRGMTAVLAMLYLTMMSTLAIGAYAAVTSAIHVADNEQGIARAFTSAESGMQFTRYQMAKLVIPYNTTQDQIFTQVWSQIQTKLNGTANMRDASGTLHNPTLTVDASGNSVITIPGLSGSAGNYTNNWMTVDSTGGHAYITITQMGVNIRIKAFGQNTYTAATPIQRIVQIDYGIAQDASSIFNYGVASKGPITMNGNAKVTGITDAMGSVLSETSANVPLTMSGSPSISGDFSYTNGSGAPVYGSGSIAGYNQASASFAQHVHGGVTPPEFPTIDTTAFAQYVPTAAAAADGLTVISSAKKPSGKNFSNIRIKANANPSFQANTTITGVVYVETPNQISFAGNLTLQGVIAVQNNPTGDTTTNTISFGGNVTAKGVETLNPATFGNLTKLSGAMMLAPSFAASFTGNFGTVSGSIIAGKLSFTGNSGGTVKGSVIGLNDTTMSLSGSSDIIVSSQGTANYPAGVYFGSHFAPLPTTYVEVTQ